MDIKRNRKLENKRVLITAGPTWVPIDGVRVIGNIATGKTGLCLAEELNRAGAEVTLLLGPSEVCCLDKRIRLVRFKFFDELKTAIVKEIRSRRYDILIHSAAVSDYRMQTSLKTKVSSGRKIWQLNLVPTPKIIDLIKKMDKNLFLVGFKFQPNAGRKLLLKEANCLLRRSESDLVVANTFSGERYSAFILNNKTAYGPVFDKVGMARELIRLIKEGI